MFCMSYSSIHTFAYAIIIENNTILTFSVIHQYVLLCFGLLLCLYVNYVEHIDNG